MLTLLGLTIGWETLALVAALAASEIIGASNLKSNGVAALVKNAVDSYIKKIRASTYWLSGPPESPLTNYTH